MMAKGIVVLAVAAAVAGAGYYRMRTHGPAAGALGQDPEEAPRAVAVEVATAMKKNVPVLLAGIGNVTTMASVAVKSRLDNEITGVHFADGAKVNKGDLLFTLDT